MRRISLLLLFVALLLVAVLFAWPGAVVPGSPAKAPAGSATAVEQRRADADVDTSSVADRLEVETGERPAASAEIRYDLLLELHVLDTLGLAFEGFRPQLGPAGGVMRGAPGTTDAHGRLTVHVPSRSPTAEIDLREPRGLRRRLTLAAGAPLRVTLLHDAPDYGRRAGPRFSFEIDAAEPERVGQALASPMRSRRMQPGLDEHTVFSEQGLVRPPDPSASQREDVASIGALEVLSGGTLRLGGGEGAIVFGGKAQVTLAEFSGSLEQLLKGREVEQLEAESSTAIRGVVFGVTGQAAQKTPVGLYKQGPQPVARTQTDEHGRYLFEGVEPGAYLVRAGGGGAGLSEGQVLAEGGIYDVNHRLSRGLTITGQVTNHAGAPMVGGRVEWRAEGDDWISEARTGADGAFLLANLPQCAGRLLVFGGQGVNKLPIAMLDGVLTGSTGLRVVAGASGTGLQVLPVVPYELSVRGARVHVLHVASGLVQELAAPARDASAEQAPWSLRGLLAGPYEVEVSRAGCGRWRSGPSLTTDHAVLDLGLAPLSAPGSLRFEVPEGGLPEGLAVEIVGQRGGHDVRLEVLRRLDHVIWIAPGAYRLLWRIGDADVMTARFEVESGVEQKLRLDW